MVIRLPITILSPARFLVAINIAGAGLGFVQGIINARLLGPEVYGIIAVVAGINAVTLNFVDIRLTDLAGKLYYEANLPDGVDRRIYQASVLQICLLGNGFISVFFATLSFSINLLTIGFFTDTPVLTWWIVAQVTTLGLTNWASTFYYLLRFSGRFFLMGSWKMVSQVGGTVIFLIPLFYWRDLNGYYLGKLASACFGISINCALATYIWKRHEKFRLFGTGILTAWRFYRQEGAFLFYGNLLGYTKLLHRAGDVLLVGYFTDDRNTGLYKLARSLTDNLYIIFDALNQVYLPYLLQLLARQAYQEYRRLARRLVTTIGLLTSVGLIFELLCLPWFIRFVLTDRFIGIEGSIVVLTLPFFLVTGIHLWVWPVFVHSGQLGLYTALNYLACLAQYGLAVLWFYLFESSAIGAAWGYLAYELLLVFGAVAIIYSHWPAILSMGSKVFGRV